jgi:biopolymer transport protein ExbB
MTALHRHPVLAPAVALVLGFAGPAMAPALALAQAAPAPAAPAPVAPAPAAAPAAMAPTAPAAPTSSTPVVATPAAPAVPGTPAVPGAAPGTPVPIAPGVNAIPATPAAPGAPAVAPAAGAPAPAAPGAAPSAAAGNATATAAAPKTEAVDNPYGLDALWNGGDLIARAVLVILVIMSLGTWYIMITKYIEQARLLGASRTATKNFWNKPSVRDGATSLKASSPFRYIADSGIAATEHHEGTLTESIDLTTWVTMSIQRAVETIQSRLQGGLAFLATVGSTAPFVGLFGTVWGIYHALTAIGIAGQASIDKVAGPVGEALIMTAIGLATAVPAVLGYNWLVRRNKASMERVRYFASDLHSVLVGGVRIGQPKSVAPPAMATSTVTRVA